MAPITAHRPGAIRAAWYRWKSLRLPWRRKWLAGYDLNGRTFWEFQNQLDPGRPRRIVQYPRGTHYGDVAFTPAWLQWLRQTRPDAPSVEEQQFELQRQSQLKQLAVAADERWRSKESFLDKPQDTAQIGPALRPRDEGGYGMGSPGFSGVDARKQGVDSILEGEAEQQGQAQQTQAQSQQRPLRPRHEDSRPEQTQNPWKQFEQRQGTPGEGWQPEAWSPDNVKPAQRR